MSHREFNLRILWYLKRLNKMRLAEIPYRLQEALRIWYDQYHFITKGRRVLLPGTDNLSTWCFNTAGRSLTFETGLRDSDAIVEQAGRCLNQNYSIFGESLNFSGTINFHRDPLTQQSWPLDFWRKIDYRFARERGGIKFAWELNRLQHWPGLAMAFHETGNARYREKICQELTLWLASNPYPRGINWISGIELGIRLVNLYFTLLLLGEAALPRSCQRQVLDFVYLHARHLYRYPSKHSSCANHALAEALGLFVAGLAWPKLKGADRWRHFGKTVLDREVTRQIYPDGSSFEHSIPYLQFVADHFLLYYLLCQRYKITCASHVQQRLNAVCSFLGHMLDCNGNVPSVGDEDGGHLLPLWTGDHNNWVSLLNTGSVLFNRADWIHPSAGWDLKSRILIGPSGRRHWTHLWQKQAWQSRSAYFAQAGLAVMAGAAGEREVRLVGNSGPLGLEPLAGHGHADALSFCLAVDGHPIFIDPGTYRYHSGGKWRRYFRSTAAHNTIQVDHTDQAVQSSDFIFDNFYRIHDLTWQDSPTHCIWTASHDGYLRLANPLLHYRRIDYDKQAQQFNIVDRLRGRGRHHVRLLFHLHPSVTWQACGAGVFELAVPGSKIVLQTDDTLQADCLRGCLDPLGGWHSAGFNRLEKTNTLAFSKTINNGATLRSEVRIV